MGPSCFGRAGLRRSPRTPAARHWPHAGPAVHADRCRRPQSGASVESREGLVDHERPATPAPGGRPARTPRMTRPAARSTPTRRRSRTRRWRRRPTAAPALLLIRDPAFRRSVLPPAFRPPFRRAQRRRSPLSKASAAGTLRQLRLQPWLRFPHRRGRPVFVVSSASAPTHAAWWQEAHRPLVLASTPSLRAVHTAFVDRMLQQFEDPAAERSALDARQATGRMVTPEEVAGAVAYLASPRSGSTTGTALQVDGGVTHLRVRPE
jgi:hypothetical protein